MLLVICSALILLVWIAATYTFKEVENLPRTVTGSGLPFTSLVIPLLDKRYAANREDDATKVCKSEAELSPQENGIEETTKRPHYSNSLMLNK